MTNKRPPAHLPSRSWRSPVFTLLGAIAFYTCIPLPPSWPLQFHGIARWAPALGLAIGSGLAAIDSGLHALGVPVLVRSAGIVVVWLGVTGGLHLDGAMDTADGLAVLDPQRRLQVMSDSHTGAFGVMAALCIVLLKITALASLDSQRWLALLAAPAWGRWGQLVAIVRYPYLKREGKGALHKAAIRSGWEVLPSLVLLLSLSGLQSYLSGDVGGALRIVLGGATIALLTGAYFNRKLNGQTGDTYGAIVEWTEALLLAWMTVGAG